MPGCETAGMRTARPESPACAGRDHDLDMTRSLRPRALLGIGLFVVAGISAACSTSQAGAGWTFGPTLSSSPEASAAASPAASGPRVLRHLRSPPRRHPPRRLQPARLRQLRPSAPSGLRRLRRRNRVARPAPDRSPHSLRQGLPTAAWRNAVSGSCSPRTPAQAREDERWPPSAAG